LISWGLKELGLCICHHVRSRRSPGKGEKGRGLHRISAAFALYTIRLVLMIFGPPVVVWLIIESHSPSSAPHRQNNTHHHHTQIQSLETTTQTHLLSRATRVCQRHRVARADTTPRWPFSSPAFRPPGRGCSRVRETTVLVCESVHHAVLWQRNMISSQASSISAL
jgi:hypothetical protein